MKRDKQRLMRLIRDGVRQRYCSGVFVFHRHLFGIQIDIGDVSGGTHERVGTTRVYKIIFIEFVKLTTRAATNTRVHVNL